MNGGTCYNKPGSYECKCTSGYDGEHCENGESLSSNTYLRISFSFLEWFLFIQIDWYKIYYLIFSNPFTEIIFAECAIVMQSSNQFAFLGINEISLETKFRRNLRLTS